MVVRHARQSLRSLTYVVVELRHVLGILLHLTLERLRNLEKVCCSGVFSLTAYVIQSARDLAQSFHRYALSKPS